jgi:hypothetical protein
MFPTLALAVALSSALGQSEQLTISNVRATYGRFGPVRPEDEILPFDTYVVAFNVDGLKANEEGKILYTMSMRVTNDRGKVVYGLDPQDLETVNFLGGSTMPAFGFFYAGTNSPGEYLFEETVVDRITKSKQTLKRKFKILPKAFGMIGLTFSYDPDNRFPAPTSGVTGQTIWIHFGVSGFERDNQRKQPDVVAEMRVLDENNKPTLAKPLFQRIKSGIEQNAEIIPFDLRLPLNRPGKFTVEIRAIDKIGKKESGEVKLSFPVVVTEQKATDGKEQK